MKNRTLIARMSRFILKLGMAATLAIMGGVASAHNLDASAVYVFFDPDTQELFDARIEDPLWVPPQPLLRAGDELGVIIKAVPDDGTETGVGGYSTFYVPNGVQVLDAAFLVPGNDDSDGITGYDRVAVHGQAAMPSVGAGGDPTVDVSTLQRGPNAIGVTSFMADAGNANLGTLPGVYGDNGIFYSTAPETAFGSYPGSKDPVTGDITNALTNNSGDTIGSRTQLGTPLNEWDAWQMQAYGISGSDNPAYSGSPVIDSNGRGNAPWGLASAVAGPESGYAWEFDKDKYDACDPIPYAPTTACVDEATQDIGPWKRIKYPGSTIANDPPGANPPDQPYVMGQGTDLGKDLTTTDLPPTVSQTLNDDSPKAIRWALGQLTLLSPEYVWVKLKVINPDEIVGETGCPIWWADTFGGDAGGDSGGKDHIWRYYDPNSRILNGCVAAGKTSDREIVKSGDIFQYKIKYYNAGPSDLANVTLRDVLPSGVNFLSSVPAQSSGPNPLIWNLGTMLRGEKFEALVNVEASGSGALSNEICVEGVDYSTGTTVESCSNEITPSGNYPYLITNKSVSPTSIAPGGDVQYTITIDNIGSGPSGDPVIISEYLAGGFIYLSTDSVMVGAANLTASTSVDATDTNKPIFTIPAGIDPGDSLVLKLMVRVPVTAEPDSYCNSFTVSQGGINNTTGALACLNVGGGKIGGNVFRDWDGDGTADSGDEGTPAVPVSLYQCVDGCGGTDDILLKSTTTDADGNYVFEGLAPDAAGTDYRIVVDDGAGSPVDGYTQTAEPPGTGCSGSCENTYDVNLTEAANESLSNDFGYQPAGSGAIGDLVYETLTNDGDYDSGTDVPINGVKVFLYEDTNGNGYIDPDDQKISEATTAGGGLYSFADLAEGLDYVVVVPRTENDAVMGGHFTPNTYTISTGLSNPVAVSDLSGTYNDADFGFFEVVASNLGGRAYQEEDGTEGYNPGAGDVPMANVTVTLKDSNGIVIATTTTDSNGLYLFSNITGDTTYTVDIDQADPDVPTGYSPSRDNLSVYVDLSEDSFENDFPFTQLLSKTANVANPSPGDTITYTVTPNYTGENLLTNVTVTDPIPDGTTYVADSAGQGGFIGTGSAGPITIEVSKDTYLNQSNGDRNFGTCATLSTGKDPNNVKHALLAFDLSEIPSTATITSAKLYMQKSAGDNDVFPETVHRVTADWDEGGNCDANDVPNESNWTERQATNVAWGSAGGDYDPTIEGETSVGAVGPYNWTITSLVQEWVDGSATNYGLLVKRKDGNTVNKEHIYDTSDGTGVVPYLEITYTNGVVGEVTWNIGSNTTAVDGSTGGTDTSTFSAPPLSDNLDSGRDTGSGPVDNNDRLTGSANITPDSIATDSNGDLHIVFNQNGANTYYTKSTDGGANWSTVLQINVSPDGKDRQAAIAVDGNDDIHVVVVDEDKNVFYRKSTNGGTSFSAKVEIGNSRGTDGNDKDPDIVVDASGNIHVSFNQNNANTFYTQSTDGGATWSTPLQIDASPDGKDKSSQIAVYGSNVYIVIDDDTKNIFLRKSTDAGGTFATAVEIDGTVGDGTDRYPDITVEPSNGDLHVVFNRNGAGTYYIKSSDAGTNWTTPLDITSSSGSDENAAIAVDRFGFIHVAVSQNNTSIFYQYSTDGGDNFVGETEIDTAVGNSTDRYPAIAVSSDAVHVVFEQNGNHVYYNGADILAPTTSTMSAVGTLVSDGNSVTVTQTFGAEIAVTGVTPANFTTTVAGGASAGTCTGPNPASGDITAGGTIDFSWTCPLNAGTEVGGSVTFSADATGSNAGDTISFTTATSNSVLVTPQLTFQVTVDDVGGQIQIDNTATINEDGTTVDGEDSNTVVTPVKALIGDTIFTDWNQDGIQDPGEDGIVGVTVVLDDGVCDPATIGETDSCQRDTTDISGNYTFNNLPAGNYTVNVIAGAGTPLEDYVPVSDPDGTGTANTTSLSLAESEANYDTDFGYRPTGIDPGGSSIGDTVFEDTNSNNVFDSGTDIPMANITVDLYYDTNGNGVYDAGDLLYGSTESDANGYYLFDGLPDANFIVVVDTEDPNIPQGLEAQIIEFAVDTDGTSDHLDKDFPFKVELPIIYKWVDKTTVDPFDTNDTNRTVTYALGINYSGGLLDTINVTDEIPQGSTYVDGSANLGGTLTDGVLEWSLDGNTAGTPGLYVESPYIYALRGDDKPDFWRYDVTNSNWECPDGTTAIDETNCAYTPTTVREGGSLVTLDGKIYALGGKDTSSFWVYDLGTSIGNDSWTTLDSTPATVNLGGALATNGTFIYALRGDSTNEFWRYDVATDTWEADAVTDLPTGTLIGDGGALVSDGKNIYALRGNDTNEFWRYNIASDTWTELDNTPDESGGDPGDVGQGGGLTFDGTSIYAVRGNGTTDFWRYDLLTNSWSTLAVVPEGVEKGGDLANFGGFVYALTGNGVGYYRYDINATTPTWSALGDAPENVKYGGSLSFLPTGNQTTTTIAVTPSVVSCDVIPNVTTDVTADNCPYSVVVTMTVTNDGSSTLTNVQGGTLTEANVGTGTATVGYESGPAEGAVSIDAGASQVFTYVYNVTADIANVSEVTFTGSAFDGGSNPFASATSPSAVITPMLTFKALVTLVPSGQTPKVDPVINLGTLSSTNVVKLGPDVCYAVADETTDTLVSVGRLSPYDVVDVGATGTTHIESLVWNLDKTVLYTTDRFSGASGSDEFGTLDPDTGVFTGYGVRLGSLRVPGQTTDTTLDVDAMSFDPVTGRLYAVNRREVGNSFAYLDTLFQIDPTTGRVIQNAFGAGVDGVTIRTDLISGDPLYDVDGLAFDPLTGILYGIANTSPTAGNGVGDHLVIINKSTGAVTDVGRLTEGASDFVDDMEGISFFDDGTLYGVTGDGSATDDQNSFWVLDKATGDVSWLRQFPNHSDYESIACLDGPTDETVGLPPTSSNVVETYLSASIGDYVWSDINGDGVQDGNEPGLADVQVCATNGTVTVCDITDSSGEYRLAGLSGDTWTVSVNTDTIAGDLYPTAPTSLVYELGSAEEYLGADFGFTLVSNPSSVGDTVWLDADEDGVLDFNEDGLEGVTVLLIDCGTDNICGNTDDFTAATTSTDADGKYLFSGLPTKAGGKNYRVQVDETASVAIPNGGSAILGDSADLVSVAGVTTGTLNNYTDVNIDSAGGDSELGADFGYNWTGSIGDLSWYDKNGNGIQDGPTDPALCDNSDPTHECGAPNTTVQIRWDSNGSGALDPGDQLLVQVTSDGTQDVDGDGIIDPVGYYNFTNLPPGNYWVIAGEQEVPAPDSSPNAGEIGTMIATTGTFVPVTLNAGEVRNDVDFGFKEAAIIEGTLFHDVNANGITDSGEPGIVGDGTATAGVLITLAGTDINGNSVTMTTYTDENGDYEFVVDPGNYSISYSSGDTNLPTDLTTATTPLTINVEVESGDEVSNLNFGIDNNGAIGDRIWNDADGDGVQDAGEAGIAGVTVQLFASDGTTLIATKATDADGNYDFIGLEDGDYIVKVADSNFDTGASLDGRDPTGNPDVTPPNTVPGVCPACDNSSGTVTISGGNQDDTIDFGYYLAGVVTHSVSGNIWDDNGGTSGTAGDGVKDTGEPDLSGVTVIVEVDTDNDGVVDDTYTLITDSSGNYSVSGIPAGSKVTVTVDTSTLPSDAYVNTGDPDVTPPNTTPGECAGCDSTTVITSLTTDETGLDFGYDQDLGSIAGSVCDGNGDGLCDSAQFDTGIGSVTVTLTWSGDDGILGNADDVTVTVQTDANGDYIFDGTTIEPGNCTASNPPYTACPLDNGLLPGIYQISETNPFGYESLADADGGNPDNISVNLTAGQILANQDFEDTLIQASIGDFVWLDADGDGVQDNGEPGLANVDVQLYLDDGDGIFEPGTDDILVATQTTDTRGEYLFEGVGSGDYFVNVVDGTIPTNLEIHPAIDEPSALIEITGAEERRDVDFGYIHDDFDTGEHDKAILGDRIWADANGNGIQDSGEAGIEGVTLTLIDDTGATVATTTTGPAGDYLFTNLDPDTYRVVVDDSNFTTVSDPLYGFTVTDGAQSEGDDTSLARTLLAGDIIVNVDFGYDNDTVGVLNTISDKVWFDFDGQGDYNDGTDFGIGGVTVILTDSAGNAIATTETDANGDFSFTGVPAGDYQIRITDNTSELVSYSGTNKGGALSDSDVYNSLVDINGDGLTNSLDDGLLRGLVDVGDNGSVEASSVAVYGGLLDLDGDGTAGTGDTGTFGGADVVDGVITDTQFTTAWSGVPVTVTDVDVSGTNFGYNIPGSFGDTVWSDHNDNEVQDPGEVGIANVMVRLYQESGATGGFQPGEDLLIATQFTDGSGHYLFEGIQNPGTYYSVIDQGQAVLSDYTRTTAADDTGDLAAMTATLETTGATFLDADYGYLNTALPDLSGNVWNDLNRNAVIDGGEPDITGVTINLVDANGIVVATAITDVNGDYTFFDVVEGDYKVVVSDTDRVLKGFELTSGLDEISVTVGTESIGGVDFGYARKVETGTIGDRIWLDSNGDGVQSPSEVGISGVTVELFNSDNVSQGKAVTDTNGNYLFNELPAGDYYVVVSGLPVDLQLTAGTPGTAGTFTLSEGETRLDLDFGYEPTDTTVLLGDTVWYDTNGNGVHDAGEAGIGGVTINVMDSGGNVITVTTNPDGTWLATGLDPDSYTVWVDTATLPVGIVTTPTNLNGGDTYVTPDMTAGDSLLSLDFGFTGAVGASIGDEVFLDANGNGVWDSGEGLSNVELYLYDANDLGPDGIARSGDETVLTSVITDADGKYLFTNLLPGDYYVDLNELNLPNSGVDLTQSVGTDPSADISLSAGEAYTTADFGYVSQDSAAIGDRIWSDANGDGVQDPGEIGIGGVTVELQSTSCTAGVDCPTTTTNSDGSYLFTGIADGTYDVVVTDSANRLTNYTQTGDPDESAPPFCTVCDGTDVSVVVVAGDITLASDFGYQDSTNAAAFIGDTVYRDDDGDGTQNGAESGIPDVTVSLYGAGGDGVIGTTDDVLVSTQTTDGNGNYGFSGLPAGKYNVVVTDVDSKLTGLVPTQSVTEINCTGTTCAVTGDGGTEPNDADFGFAPSTTIGSIGDEVFIDVNGDGIRNAGEGLSGVTVDLYDPGPDGIVGGTDDVLLATTTTDTDGNYLFNGLPPGKYYVAVDETTLPSGGTGLTGTSDTGPYTPGTNADNGNTALIDLGTGVVNADADFGYVSGSGAIIGDRIWSDANGNGVQDPGEAGIGGVSVELQSTSCTAGVDCPTTTTNSDGSYLFTGVPADTYNVVVTDTGGVLAAYTQTFDPDVAPPCSGGDCNDTDSSVVVAALDIKLDSDFGYRDTTNADASIGDTIYRDENGDGTKDTNEAGIAGVTVNLLDSNGSIVATMTTDASGNYDFTGLEAGDYTVEVTDTNGVLNGLSATETEGVINLANNQDYTDADFGFAPGGDSGSIGDTIYFDSDGSGTQNGSEAGISGVTVNLLDSNGNIVATKTTDANGNYTFDGLAAGLYSVEITDQNSVLSNLIPTEVAEGSLLISCANTCTDITDADFGYKPTVGGGDSNIGGTIWHDSLKPAGTVGTLQPEESGIQGVEVELWLDDGDGIIEPGIDNLVRTTLTDANGDYNFLGLPPGNYVVRVPDDSVENVDGLTGVNANPALINMDSVLGPLPTQDSNGHLNPYAVALPANTTDTSVDFAYDATTAYTIDGTVFEDNGGDGTLGAKDVDTIDPRIEGVTVRLYRDVGGVEYLIGTTTTDINGDYSFGSLPAGDYSVKVDISGTTIDGMQQTYENDATTAGDDCTDCDASTPVTLGPNATEVDFGFWNGDVVTTPISLAYFEAREQGGKLSIEWWTATETRNIGFDLYADFDGEWLRLNQEMIPSRVIDSVDPQQYTFETSGIGAGVFWITDLDYKGKERLHGPFELGKKFGRKPKVKPIDWKEIRDKHLSKKEAWKASRIAMKSGSGLAISAAKAKSAKPEPTVPTAINLLVTADGLYRVTYEDLTDAGLNLDRVKVNDIALLSQGSPVAVTVAGQTGGKKVNASKFGPGAYVEFVGHTRNSLYSDTNVYTLTVNKRAVLDIDVDNTALPAGVEPEAYYMETVSVEHNLKYSSASPTGDPWYEADVVASGGPAERKLPISIDHYVAGEAASRLQLEIWGGTDFPVAPDHAVEVSLNGSGTLASERFDGVVQKFLNADVPEGLLAEGENALTLSLPFDLGADVWWDVIGIEGYSLTYPRSFVARDGGLVFNAAGAVFAVDGLPDEDILVYRVDMDGVISRLANVVIEPGVLGHRAIFPGTATEATYYVSAVTALGQAGMEMAADPVNCASGDPARYLVVAHRDFMNDDLQRLIDVREREGYSTAVIPVDGLYAEYSAHLVDPEAIRACIADAVANRGTEAVLLVGAATYDDKDYLEQGAMSHIPAIYSATDDLVQFAPLDPLYVPLDQYGAPTLPIGRFPVRTSADLAYVVDKTLAYATKDYGKTAVLAADVYDAWQTYSFREDAVEIVNSMPADWDVTEVYMDDLGLNSSRDLLFGAMNAGSAITAYIGHSDEIGWNWDGLFYYWDVEDMTNEGRPTVVTQWGCWNTYFVSPTNDTLGHAFLLTGRQGAAAVLGASTLTEAEREAELGKRLFGVGGLATPGVTLGEAMVRAKRDLAQEHPDWLDVILGWQLLGDPLLPVEALGQQ